MASRSPIAIWCRLCSRSCMFSSQEKTVCVSAAERFCAIERHNPHSSSIGRRRCQLGGAIAIPMLVPIETVFSPMMNGSDSSAMTRLATRSTSASDFGATCMIANSSPPSRATVSVSRMVPINRCATAFNRKSPTGWPKVSLTDLNRSRSRQCSASVSPRLTRARPRSDAIVEEGAVGKACQERRGAPGAPMVS